MPETTRDGFVRLRAWLEAGARANDAPRVDDRCHRRLVRALTSSATSARTSGWLGPADVVALVAHVLRREAALSPMGYPSLRVPRPLPPGEQGGHVAWPDLHQWLGASLSAREEGARIRLAPLAWEPDWLGAPGAALTDPLFAETPRRTYDAVPGDPFLTAARLTHYRSDAQRAAIRAILSVPDGSSVVVNLPTGAGKSLCAHLPALLRSQPSGVTVVAVPTVALALDQERALEHLVGHRTAYVGGATASADEARDGIRARVRDGSQRIVFTSPESLLGSLRSAVYEAARRGFLRLFVVDEAHMVEQWGDEFRSSFQELAGLRTDLRRHVPEGAPPFTTVLLTATLTEAAYDTLETLFGGGAGLVSVSVAQLRPEPSYWAAEARDEAQRRAAVLEAVRHLPRPLMLYLTEPADAEGWAARLNAEGYRRLDVVTGRTSNDARAAIIRRWRDADVDIVVATSAFGLGVDQGDVRAVLHATIPENVDRFYQEVGRGGRDGAACASLVIYTPEDRARAASLNRKKIIGIERGRERWASMFYKRVTLGGARVRVPIDARPNLADGIDMDGDLNRAWNVRTLTLLSRTRLLGFDAEPPPRLEPAGGGHEADVEEAYGRAYAEQQRHRVVSLRHDGTVSSDLWAARVEPTRQRAAASDRRAHALMLELLRGVRCASEILSDAYVVPRRDGDAPRPEVPVAAACGGCAHCRATRRVPFATPLPTPLPEWPTDARLGPELERLRGAAGAIAIFYARQPSPHHLTRLLRWLVGQGVRLVVAPSDARRLADVTYQPGVDGRWVFTYALESFRFMEAPRAPGLVYLPPGVPLPRRLHGAFTHDDAERPPRVLLAPSDTVDPSVPHRRLRTTLGCRTYDYYEFLQQVGL